MDTLDKNELSRLIIESVEGVITSERLSRLDQLLFEHSEAVEYYVHHLRIYSFMEKHSVILFEHDQIDPTNTFNFEIWKELGEYEKIAPVIELPKEVPQRELIQKVVYPPREKRKVSKFNIIFLAMNAAAILFFVLFLRFVPSKGGVEVATLTDSFNAKWADITGSMDKGARLVTRSDELFLREGLVELMFDNNAKVVIEGPAEFEVLAVDRIDLQFGRVYATVPQEAIGFMVSTPTSRIIDLGTEFGVQADAFGDVQLHVIRGKTSLISGDRSNRVNMEVTEGQAKRMSGSTGSITDIPCETKLFVRDINSDNRFVWKGQMNLDLADMVGGGNGFGTGKLDWAIDPLTGKQTNICNAVRSFSGQNEYIMIPWSDLIDGVFTIGTDSKTVIVSSQGHRFEECPDTLGMFWGQILNGAKVVQDGSAVPYIDFQYQGALQGKPFGTPTNPAIFMEPNMGITLNLDRIRKSLPSGLKIRSFSSICGLCDSDERIAKSDFWVLLDGKVRDRKIGLRSNDRPVSSDIPLNDNDHFLTLITTDNDRDIIRDWCLFARPTLYLEKME